MVMNQTNSGSNPQNKFLYNGKELQDDVIAGQKLDWYDYGARMYDAAVGRFHTIDPWAEKYTFQTPYAYAANNPVRYIDFMGLGAEEFLNYLFYTYHGNSSHSVTNIVNHYTNTKNKDGSTTKTQTQTVTITTITKTKDDDSGGVSNPFVVTQQVNTKVTTQKPLDTDNTCAFGNNTVAVAMETVGRPSITAGPVVELENFNINDTYNETVSEVRQWVGENSFDKSLFNDTKAMEYISAIGGAAATGASAAALVISGATTLAKTSVIGSAVFTGINIYGIIKKDFTNFAGTTMYLNSYRK